MLGAVLASQVADRHHRSGLAAAGIPVERRRRAAASTSTRCPRRSRQIVRAAYGDATGHIFLISAAIAVVGVIAALFLPPIQLRDSLDLEPAAPAADGEPVRSA